MPAEHLPVFALDNDSIVEIKGDPVGLHKAVELIATHLRNFLVDHRAVGAIRAEVSNMVTFVKKRKGGVLSLIHCYNMVYSFYSDAKVKYSSKPKYASTPIRVKLSQCLPLNISHLHVNVKITTLLQTCLLWTSHLILAHLLMEEMHLLGLTRWAFLHNNQWSQRFSSFFFSVSLFCFTFNDDYLVIDLGLTHNISYIEMSENDDGFELLLLEFSLVLWIDNKITASLLFLLVTQIMQIPISYADAVIGTSGSNISCIRHSCCATIAIQTRRGALGEMTVEINGSASQVHAAQQMIQVPLPHPSPSYFLFYDINLFWFY